MTTNPIIRAVFNFDDAITTYDTDNVLYVSEANNVYCRPIDRPGETLEWVSRDFRNDETDSFRSLLAADTVCAAEAIRRFVESGGFNGHNYEQFALPHGYHRRTKATIATKSVYIEQWANTPPIGQSIVWPSVYHVSPR